MTELLEHGTNIFQNVEVINISKHGFWIAYKNKEYFLSFDDFPWFKNKPLSAIFDVKEVSPGHFYWTKLDIDLSEEIIKNPIRFPLIAKEKIKNKETKG